MEREETDVEKERGREHRQGPLAVVSLICILSKQKISIVMPPSFPLCPVSLM